MNPTCCVCGNAPRDFVGALTIRGGKDYCRDETGCAHRQAKAQAGVRAAVTKPAERRAIGGDEPGKRHARGFPSDGEKAAFFAQHGEAGPVATKDADTPTVKAPVAAPARRRTAEQILNNLYPEDEPTPTAAKSTPISATAEAAWQRLQAAVESGDAEAMCQACLDYADAMGLQIKSHRLTAEQILNGEGGSASRQLSAERERLHRSLERIGKMTVTVTDDEDQAGEMNDEAAETETGAAPNLALTADQQMYWERLQSVVSGSGGISDSLETAARNFYNSVSVAV